MNFDLKEAQSVAAAELFDGDAGPFLREACDVIEQQAKRLAKLEAVAEAALQVYRNIEDPLVRGWLAKDLRAAGYLEGQDRGDK